MFRLLNRMIVEKEFWGVGCGVWSWSLESGVCSLEPGEMRPLHMDAGGCCGGPSLMYGVLWRSVGIAVSQGQQMMADSSTESRGKKLSHRSL